VAAASRHVIRLLERPCELWRLHRAAGAEGRKAKAEAQADATIAQALAAPSGRSSAMQRDCQAWKRTAVLENVAAGSAWPMAHRLHSMLVAGVVISPADAAMNRMDFADADSPPIPACAFVQLP
jgi:hypothetical protein